MIKEDNPQYKAFFLLDPLPKFVLDLDTKEILDANTAAVVKYGIDRKELISSCFDSFTFAGAAHLPLLEGIESGTFGPALFAHKDQYGGRMMMEITAVLFPSYGSRRAIVTCIDVTGRENMARRFRSTEKKLLAAQEISKIGYWKYDMEKETLFWSDEVYKIWGVDKETFVVNYPAFFQSIHCDDLGPFKAARDLALAGKKDMDFEFRIVVPGASEKWIHEKGKLIKNAEGKNVSFEGTVQDVTESKLLKISLEQSNQRYEYATQATFDAIWDYDLLSKKIYWGEGFSRIFGYDMTEYAGQPLFWEERIHPDQRDAVLDEMYKVLNSRDELWRGEYSFKKADNTYALVLDRARIVRDAEGKAVRMVGAMHDISQIRNLQRLLDKANRLAKIGSWEIDVKTSKVFWSRITREIRETDPGYEPRLDDGISHFKEGFSRDTIKARVKECIEQGTSWREELEIYTHKGNLKWVRTIGKAEFQDGKCVKIYGSFQDIDASKKAELEIRKLYEEKTSILESIGDGFFAIDNEWKVTWCNVHAENMFGLLRNEIIGKDLRVALPFVPGSLIENKFEQSLADSASLSFEIHHEPLEKWFEIICYPSGAGLSVFVKDISERKASQIKLHELHESLKKTASELAASNAELRQFAYIASHDLQEPLRMVTGFLSLFEKKYAGIVDQEGREYINFAVDGGKRMTQMINDLLEFSRLGRCNGRLEQVDLKEIVDNSRAVYKEKIISSNATIKTGKLPVIIGYKEPLDRVFQNLISNALKYRKADASPIVQIDCENKNGQWIVSVADNGIGIEPDHHERIFVLFQRLHGKNQYPGNGIGLSSVKKIVESMGGNVWLESEKGKGSTFYIALPER